MSYKTTWELVHQEEPGEPFGDKNSLNGFPYPSWWPSLRCLNKKQSKLEMLYGFPFLSWWELERGQMFDKMPKIDLNTFQAPTQALLDTMPILDSLGKKWGEKSKGWDDTWIVEMCSFWDSDPKSHYKLWESYLAENCSPQLQYFGVPFQSINNGLIFKPDSLFFRVPLSYCPGKWTLMVVFSLMIYIVHQIKNDPNSPFLFWTAIDRYNSAKKSPWLSDQTKFQFPILSWLKVKDEIQIMQTVDRIRGYRTPHFQMPNLEEVTLQKFSCFFCFIKFYKEDGFSKFSQQELYFGFSGPFRWLYNDMISHMKKDSTQSAFLRNIDGPNGIYNNPFSNLKSSTDWMVWSLIIMWNDLKYGNSDMFEAVQKINPNEDHFRGTMILPFNQLKGNDDADRYNEDFDKRLKEKWDERSTDGSPPRPLIAPPFQAGRLLNNFLIDFQYAWRKTAEYHFLGIDAPKWPPPFPLIPFEDSTSTDARIYDFITKNPPRKLKVPAVDNLFFQRLSWKWEAVYKEQYTWYLEWVYFNVMAQDNLNYVYPGVQLKNEKGENVFVQQEDGSFIPVLNSFPNLIMVNEDGPGLLAVSASFLIIPIDQAAKFIWGDEWTDFLDALGKKIWKMVKETLIAIGKGIKKILDDFAPDWEKYLALIAVGVVVVFGGWSFADEKIRKLAR